MERVGKFILKVRLAILVAVLAVTGVLLYYALQLPVRISLEKLFPYNHPFVQLNKDLGTKFGGTNTMLIMVKAKTGSLYTKEMLETANSVTDYFKYKPYAVMSLVASITLEKSKYVRASGMDVLEMKPVFGAGFDNSAESFSFARQMTYESGVFQGLLASDDDSSALVIVEVKDDTDYVKLGADIASLKADLARSGVAELHMSGRPVLLSRIYKLSAEVGYLALFVFLLTVGILWVLYRNPYGVITITVVAILCAIWGLGLMSLMRFELSPLLMILPILVSTRAISHSLQIYSRYVEEYAASGSDTTAAMKNTIVNMMIPNWSAVLTDALGFFILYLIKITIIQEIAISMGIWILTLALLAGMFLPVLASYLPCRVTESDKLSGMDRLSSRVGSFSITRKGTAVVAAASVVVIAFSAYNLSKLQIGDEFPGSSLLFPKDEYNEDTRIINGAFSKAGADGLVLFFQGKENDALKDPSVLRYLDRFERHVMAQMPEVARGAWSLVTVLKKINTELHGGDPKWSLIPDTKAMCANLIFMFSMKNDATEFSRYTDPTYQIGNTVIFFKDHTPATIKRMESVCNDFFRANPPKTGMGEFKYAGGSMGLEGATTNVVETSHTKIDLYILGTVFLICILSYMSVLAGTMLTVPLIAANVVVTGLMAFMHIGLTIDTLPVVAIGVGIGVDFGIYLFSRVKEEMPLTNNDYVEALHRSFLTTGKSILFSGLTMVLPLYLIGIFTKIKFQAQMGILIGTILLINMLWSLTVHPILIHYFKPRFLLSKTPAAEKAREPVLETVQ